MNINRSAVYYYLLLFENVVFLGRQNIIESFWYTIYIGFVYIYSNVENILNIQYIRSECWTYIACILEFEYYSKYILDTQCNIYNI